MELIHMAGIAFDLRYASTNNLTGAPLPGYCAHKLWGTPALFTALKAVQEVAQQQGYQLLVFDAYRPQKAVDALVRWAQSPDTSYADKYYPRIAKKNLLALAYIASPSSHSRGSTVDLTLTLNGVPLDMGTPFDTMDILSWHSASGLTAQQQTNRCMLKGIMEQHNFVPYEREWWHYRLDDEPYRDTYFDYDIK